MATAASGTLRDVEVFRYQARLIHWVVRTNVDGLGQEESLVQPEPAGNCLNWVVGHLVQTYEMLLPLLGQERVLEEGALARYARGSDPITDPSEARNLDELLAAWDEASKRVNRGLRQLTAEDLEGPAPRIPGVENEENLRSFLTATFFHQGYHAGQTGLLRRLAGVEGAIP